MSEKQEPCDECTLNAGMGVAFGICKLANVPFNDIREDLFNAKIDVQTAMDRMKERLKSDAFHTELIREVEDVMKTQLAENELQRARIEAGKGCVSVVVKQEMAKTIGNWIADREKVLQESPPGSKFAKGIEELVQNLRSSKQMIDDLPACEET